MAARMSPKAALLVLLGLMFTLWALLGVEVATHQVDFITVVMAITFSLLLVAWPFLNGLRLTSQGAVQLAVCRECQMMSPRGFDFGFCIHCGAFASKTNRPHVAGRSA